MHGVAFSPWGAGELACVGQGTLTLWLMQQRGADVSLQVPGFRGGLADGARLRPGTSLTPPALQVHHRDPIPEAVGAGELTSLCYGAEPLLYCGSNAGQVCVWDTHAGRCFLTWEADDGEIGGCLRGPHGPPQQGAPGMGQEEPVSTSGHLGKWLMLPLAS